MKPRTSRLIAVVCALLGGASALAAGCPVTDKEFLRQITANNDWPAVYSIFRRNLPACRDDGLYADGYANMVVNSLALHWADLHFLERLFARDRRFERFVFDHISASAAADDLQRVLRQARERCPEKSAHLCGEIESHVRAAIAGKR